MKKSKNKEEEIVPLKIKKSTREFVHSLKQGKETADDVIRRKLNFKGEGENEN